MTEQQMQIIDDACLAAIRALPAGDDHIWIEWVMVHLGRGDLKDLTEAVMDDLVRDAIRQRARVLGVELRD
jgi:hypothetical protein